MDPAADTDLPEHAAGWDVITRHYEACLSAHGATPQGADWPNGADLATRFGVMLELLRETGDRPTLLDLGCGPGLLLDYLTAIGQIDRVDYRGIDRSSAMIDHAKRRSPDHSFECRDIIANPLPEQSVDVVVMNGVLCERLSIPIERMTELAESLVAAAFRAARIGIAFNAMNVHVDWQRDDLFHWPFDALAGFLKRRVSRHYVIRADYGLYEYTCFVLRRPHLPPPPPRATWWAR